MVVNTRGGGAAPAYDKRARQAGLERRGAAGGAGAQSDRGEARRLPRGDEAGVVRVGRGRGAAVDPDAVRGEVHGGRPDEVVDPALVERVRADARAAVPAVGGGDA